MRFVTNLMQVFDNEKNSNFVDLIRNKHNDLPDPLKGSSGTSCLYNLALYQ